MNAIIEPFSTVHTQLERWARGRLRERVLVVAAHPGDETIGCGGALGRLTDVWILGVTDGVPEDERHAREAGFPSREAYRAARIRESVSALAKASIPAWRISSLRCPDQAASLQLVALARTLRSRILALRPALVVTHAYEGGHPDHDATRFIVGAALAGIRRAPPLCEMTAFHAEGVRHSVGRFLEDLDSDDIVTLPLSGLERARKRAMLDSFVSRANALAPFAAGVGDELLRPAKKVDFSRPPHPGRLFYERFDWGMSGDRFRELVCAAQAELA